MAQGRGVGNAMQGVGVLILSVGVWLLYCAIVNLQPGKTLIAILQNPQNARDILNRKENRISQDSFTADRGVGGSLGGGVSGGITGTGAAAIVAFARAQIGKPYASPGDSQNTWDCSGLTKSAVKAGTGIDLPHSATLQALSTKGRSVKREELQAGDIVFPSVGHCGVMSGRDTVIHAPTWGRKVEERNLWAFISAKRFVSPDAIDNSGGGGGGGGR